MESPRRKKNPLNPQRYLWQAIVSSVARGSVPSWGIPFEAIAASMLLRDRQRKKRQKVDAEDE